MKQPKSALFCSAAATVCLGIFLSIGGIVPTSALSYGMAPTERNLTAEAMALSLPSLSPIPNVQEDAAVSTAGNGDEATEAIFSEADYGSTPQKRPRDAENIVKKTYPSSLSVNNKSPKEIDVSELLQHVPDIELTEEGPQILIVHTHTSESYNETGQDWYASQDTRSEENSRNMVRMGELLEEELTARGYSVLHCQKRHDKDFNSSYTMSNRTVREYLNRYPSISVVIDLHRDSLIDAGGTKYRPTVTINGEEAAQIMLLMGVGNDTYLHPNWKENLSLALRIQQQGEELYPGLMRPILVRPSRYNQHLSNGAILVELGACGNSPDEAERAAKLFGEICAAALDRIREERK